MTRFDDPRWGDLFRDRREGGRPVIKARHLLSAVDRQTPTVFTETTEADEAASRATLGFMGDCDVGGQRNRGVPPREIHRDSAELLHGVGGNARAEGPMASPSRDEPPT